MKTVTVPMPAESRMNSTPAISSPSRVIRWVLVLAAGICSTAVLGAARNQSAKPTLKTEMKPAPIDVTPTPMQARGELMHDAAPEATVASAVLPATTPKKVVWLEVTAYCSCPKCCGPHARGLTASGRSIAYNGGRFVAADTKLFKFGTRLSIPGYAGGEPVEVIDRGGAIKGFHIDVFFSSHEQARAWGRQRLAVAIEQ
jgi:3D (Asp-Asp-Asp) domain-containing protein